MQVQTGAVTRIKDVGKLEERRKKVHNFKALLGAFLNDRRAQVDLVSVNHPLDGPIGPFFPTEPSFPTEPFCPTTR